LARTRKIRVSLSAPLFPLGLEQNKSNEDRLDALIAAYVAAYFWWFGTNRSLFLGSLTDGYIVTPVNERTRKLFQSVFGAEGINPSGGATTICLARPSSIRSGAPEQVAVPVPRPLANESAWSADEGDLAGR
jgi:hypothetical protein